MGVKITWVGKREIKIIGSEKLRTVSHNIMFDRIEAGTFIIAGALIGHNLKITNIEPKVIGRELRILKKMGVKLKTKKNEIQVFESKNIRSISFIAVVTFPYTPRITRTKEPEMPGKRNAAKANAAPDIISYIGICLRIDSFSPISSFNSL